MTTATFQEGEQEAEGALVTTQALHCKRRRRMGSDACCRWGATRGEKEAALSRMSATVPCRRGIGAACMAMDPGSTDGVS